MQESHWLPGELGERPFIELDQAQRHYLAFLHRMVAEGRHVAGMEQVWLGLLAEAQQAGSRGRTRLAPRIGKVQRHIEAHLAEPLNNERLAAIACLGQSQFKHAFQQQVGMSVSHYIRARRMALARTCSPTPSCPSATWPAAAVTRIRGLRRALPGRNRLTLPLAPTKRPLAVTGRPIAEDGAGAFEAC